MSQTITNRPTSAQCEEEAPAPENSHSGEAVAKTTEENNANEDSEEQEEAGGADEEEEEEPEDVSFVSAYSVIGRHGVMDVRDVGEGFPKAYEG